MRSYTNAEIIAGLRKALSYYADPNSNPNDDLGRDDCSGFYRQKGEVARQALNLYNKNTKIVSKQ
jgi:hypothetical protein